MTTTLRPSDIRPLDLAKKALELADARPMHQYVAVGDPSQLGSCVYVQPDDAGKLVGSCLFGQAFIALGVAPEALLPVNEKGIVDVFEEDGWDLNHLENAQGSQDVGLVWGSEGVRGELVAYIEKATA